MEGEDFRMGGGPAREAIREEHTEELTCRILYGRLEGRGGRQTGEGFCCGGWQAVSIQGLQTGDR